MTVQAPTDYQNTINNITVEIDQQISQSAPSLVEKTIPQRMNDFGFDWYRETIKNKEGNALVSSLSAFTVLAMAYLGAKGNTAEEMSKVLHMPENNEELTKMLPIIMKALTHDEIFNVANNMFTHADYPMCESFLEEMARTFNAKPENLNFAENEAAASRINQWVEEKTNSKIKNLISPELLDSDTHSVLVNAIYLLANWKVQFNKESTYDRTFHLDNETSIKVPMMHKSDTYAYMENDGLKMLELQYEENDRKQRDLAMYMILPKKGNALENIEKDLSASNFELLRRSAFPREVDVAIPKFEFEDTTSLTNDLINMGMVDAFDEKADFSGVTTNCKIHVKEVLQKTYIKVDEKGTEAAAATALMFTRECAIFTRNKEFTADRPFMILVVDRASDTVLFTGRVTNPSNG